jgi:predicted acylesterase/phospholipase RssA
MFNQPGSTYPQSRVETNTLQSIRNEGAEMEEAQETKVAVACQGGGMHAAFAVGVLTEILKDVDKKRFRLVGVSGTSAGAPCAR